MSPVETLEAARVKLELLRNHSTGGEWVGWRQYNPLRGLLLGIESGGEDVMKVSTQNVSDAEMVEVLHRTIDAQLSILKDARARLAVDIGSGNPEVHYKYQLALASAILGDPA